MAVQDATLRMLTEEQRRTASLFLDDRVLTGGTVLGLDFEGIRVRSPRVSLVFVDYHPRANFGHECRYLLFDPDTARLLEEYKARFPPYPRGWPKSYQRFDDRRPQLAESIVRGARLFLARSIWRWIRFMGIVPTPGPPPPAQSTGRKFAILFAGVPDPCHLNTMEFAYRTLLSLGFHPEDIVVACYQGGPAPDCPKWHSIAGPHYWPGDAIPSPFQMFVDHPGNQIGFQNAVGQIRMKQPGTNDTLFVFISGHGNGPDGGGPGDSYIATLGGDGEYQQAQFQADLQLLLDPQATGPVLGRLVVLMGQCYAGGFVDSVKNSSIAVSTAFASASQWYTESQNDKDNDLDYTWACFARDWIAAHAGKGPGTRPVDPIFTTIQTAPAGTPTTAKVAYDYAQSKPPGHLADMPMEGYSAPAAEQIALGAP